MDDTAKRILKKKKALFSENIELDDEILKALKDSELLTAEMLTQIKVESLSKNQKTTKLIECLLLADTESAYEKLCTVLVKNHEWISKDLEIDLRIEKGDLEIDEDVAKEAAMLVNKKFGNSKRLTDVDKKEMKELMALKIQMSKAAWKKELEQVHQQLSHQSNLNNVKDTKAQYMNRIVRRFLNDHDAHLVTQAKGKTSSDLAKSNVKSSASADERLDGLKFHLDNLLSKTERCLANRELILKEREKCLKLLDVKDDKMSLDAILQDQLNDLPRQLRLSQDEYKKQNKAVQKQNETINDLEDDTHKKAKTIRFLEAQLAEITMQITDLEDNLSVLDKRTAGPVAASQPVDKQRKKTEPAAGTKSSNRKK